MNQKYTQPKRGLSTTHSAQSKGIEQSIITLQKHFLTPGMHWISVPSAEHAKHLLAMCLDSLQVYTEIGMLSTTPDEVPIKYRDMYCELIEAQALISDKSLADYMLRIFSCDFLIIEYTQELIEERWFGKFEQLLTNYAIASEIPVVMFLYDDQLPTEN